MREPIFLYDDVFPVKEYEFEGRYYYSYNNIEKILKEWYGDNCLKRFNKDKEVWEETLPMERRNSKHVRDINLEGESATNREKVILFIFIKIVFYLMLFLGLWLLLGINISFIITIIIFILSFIL